MGFNVKKTLQIINELFFVLCLSINIILVIRFGLPNDCYLLFAIALVLIIVYWTGRIFPHQTAMLVYKFAEKIYINTADISIPVIDEAMRTFKKRLPHILSIANVLLLITALVVVLS